MSDERRPLVIIGVGGGLVQWEVLKPGTGLPRLHILDYDREGADDEELVDFADRIESARADLEEYGEDPATIAELQEGADEYRRMALDGETPGRYR